jgi:hypothetical protein
MEWPRTNSQESRQLERTFSNEGIPFDIPGFSDHPNFLQCEQSDPRFLELYARYVESRGYTADYLADARKKIDVAARALADAIRIDGRLGACVDAAGMLGRMLDRLGVWNYVGKASLTIKFPAVTKFPDRYFWTFDEGEFVAAHAVVISPPFGIVDVTVRHQIYDPGEENFIPQIVLAEEWQAVKWEPEDLANPSILMMLQENRIPFDVFLNTQSPGMANVIRTLPPRAISQNGTLLKYVIVAVGGTIEPLEGILGYKPGGRTALEIFQQDIMPSLTRANDQPTLIRYSR